MSQHLAEVCTLSFIPQLLARLQLQIQQRQALKKLPHFLGSAMWQLAVENIIAVMPESGNPLKKDFEEDLLISVPKLDKDTLMPKDLSEEKVRVSPPRRLSPQSSRSSTRKGMNGTQLNSIKLADKLKSISATEKKATNRQKPARQQFSGLNISPDVEAAQPQLQQLRQKTIIRLQYQQEEAKLKGQRQKHFNEKLKRFNEAFADQDPTDIAFDYDGDPLRRTLLDEEMRLHKMKAGISHSKKKPKEGFSRLNAPELSQVEVSRKHRERGESFRALRPLEIPTFYMKNLQANEAKNLKMDEYRRRFGRGYSRLGNQTLEVPTLKKTGSESQSQKIAVGQAAQPAQGSKKAEGQGNKKAEGGQTERKLALPRLHGKYKVLDRYQDL